MNEEPEVMPFGEPEEVGVPTVVPLPDPEPESEAMAETAADIEQITTDSPRVAIVVSDHADLVILEPCEAELKRRNVSCEVRVISADEAPHAVADYTDNARMRGIRVIVAGAGPTARLPTIITTHTDLPVIGVPLSSQGADAGLDALLEKNPAPAGEPVAWLGVDDAINAAVLAARILSP
jgi:5-(carboxyamino)imidazole ribonucleotide mutase